VSTLTRIFVVLLVILSLLLAAGTVTFVSTIDNYRKSAELTMQQLRAEKARAEQQAAEISTMQAQVKESYDAATRQLEAMKNQQLALQQTIADRDTQNAQLKTQVATQGADVTRLAEALKASEDTKSKFNDTIVAQRQQMDQLQSQSADLNRTVNDLTNRLDITEQQRRNFAEQLEEARNQNTKLGSALRELGGNPQAIIASQTFSGPGAQKINGVIREVRMIAGVPYATISVGSADAVQRGMQFNIVTRNGQFLGKLVVDTVEPNESTGRLEGPRVAEVQPGAEVRTQI
jgi:septal ring factor EnvC (AmiA/AmiB activator)